MAIKKYLVNRPYQVGEIDFPYSEFGAIRRRLMASLVGALGTMPGKNHSLRIAWESTSVCPSQACL